MTWMARLRLMGIGSLSGLIAGLLIFGLGSRIVMRMVALAAGTPPVLTAGTLSFFPFGSIVGIPFGLVFVVVRRWLPGLGLGKGLAFGALMLLFPGGPFFLEGLTNADSEFQEGPLLLGMTLFGALFIANGLAVGGMAEWFERHLPTADRASRRAKVGYGVLAALGIFAIAFFILSIIGGSMMAEE